MDVVRQEIESLRGSIFINSEVGKGSTFQIKLPLTLAIIEGMLVQVQNQIFTILSFQFWNRFDQLLINSEQCRNKVK